MNYAHLKAGLKAEIAALAAKGDAATDEDVDQIEVKTAELAKAEADEAELIKRQSTLAKGMAILDEENGRKAAAEAPRVEVKGERETPGDVFVKSGAYEALLKSHPNGIPAGMPAPMSAVKVSGVKALITNPHLTPIQHIVAPVGLSITGLTDAITVVDDAPETVKIFRAAFTSAAAVVAEGALKPEASLVWTPETLNLETIAHWVPVTNQSLSHNSVLRSLIDTFLVNGIRAKLEADVATMLAGASGLGTQAFTTDVRTSLRRAITKAQTAGAQVGSVPTGILISALDAEKLDLEQFANLVLSPGETPAQATGIWRTPLVVSPQIPAGFAYVGDLRQIVLYTSGGIQVMTGWVNTQFIENELTILAETEAKSTVIVAPTIIKTALA